MWYQQGFKWTEQYGWASRFQPLETAAERQGRLWHCSALIVKRKKKRRRRRKRSIKRNKRRKRSGVFRARKENEHEIQVGGKTGREAWPSDSQC